MGSLLQAFSQLSGENRGCHDRRMIAGNQKQFDATASNGRPASLGSRADAGRGIDGLEIGDHAAVRCRNIRASGPIAEFLNPPELLGFAIVGGIGDPFGEDACEKGAG